jgi:bifunctional non-homologous end joining protein LigD
MPPAISFVPKYPSTQGQKTGKSFALHCDMALEKYNKKRDFKITSEPKGKRKASRFGHRFFIQKHAASHLHFDFRLEYNGVLKSWAVPKGPSISRKVRRLAMEVEDHPLDYGNFEGTIPRGEYGGGTVMLWDEGSWEALDDPSKGFKTGKLHFKLKGKRLNGEWALIRPYNEEDKRNQWFLFKVGDSNLKKEPVETQQTSVVSGRTMDEIAGSKKQKVWHSNKKKASINLRDFNVQLATLAEDAPSGEEWIHEVKFDGYRILSAFQDGKVTLMSRNHLDWTAKIPSVAEAIKDLDVNDAVFDGEVVVLGPKGHSDFQALQLAFKEKKEVQFKYYIFDILHLNGEDLRETSLEERKTLLKKILHPTVSKKSVLQFSDFVKGEGPKIFQNACRLGLEGIVSKKANAPYASGRSLEWLKVKCILQQEFVIIGYTMPQGTRSSFGALLLAVYENDSLRYVGKTGTGFNTKSLADIKAKLDRVKVSKTTAVDPSGELKKERDINWVKPKYVAEVKFGSWTNDKRIRHSSFLGIRLDKEPAEVRIEIPKTTNLTNQDKILFSPDISKLELANYYVGIEKYIAPYIYGRPLALVRCPDGHEKFCFFQKHIMEKNVKKLNKSDNYLKAAPNEEDFVYIESSAGLQTLVQMGVLEIHGWGATVADYEHPDKIVIDLDQHADVGWSSMIETAFKLKERFEKLKLKSFVKTTGGKGLHIVIPIVPQKNWNQVKAFTKLVAETFVQEFPDQYTANMAKSKRVNKIFIDYLRNGRGATAVLPYSTRAKRNAPIAVPLSWKELPKINSGDQFNIRNIFLRMKELKADPWREFFKIKQKIPEL